MPSVTVSRTVLRTSRGAAGPRRRIALVGHHDAVIAGGGVIGLSSAWLGSSRRARGRRGGPRRRDRRLMGGGRDARAGHRGALQRGGAARVEPAGSRGLAGLRRRPRGGNRPRGRLPPLRHPRRRGRRRRSRRCSRTCTASSSSSASPPPGAAPPTAGVSRPCSARRIRGGILVPGDHQADPGGSSGRSSPPAKQPG